MTLIDTAAPATQKQEPQSLEEAIQGFEDEQTYASWLYVERFYRFQDEEQKLAADLAKAEEKQAAEAEALKAQDDDN